MRSWRTLFRRDVSAPAIDQIHQIRAGACRLTDDDLKKAARRARTLPDVVALTAVVASRVLSLQMFDEQITAALALADGKIVEMQTGEGKTLAAVPAIAWYARGGRRRSRHDGQRLSRPARRRMDGRHLRLARPDGRRQSSRR